MLEAKGAVGNTLGAHRVWGLVANRFMSRALREERKRSLFGGNWVKWVTWASSFGTDVVTNGHYIHTGTHLLTLFVACPVLCRQPARPSTVLNFIHFVCASTTMSCSMYIKTPGSCTLQGLTKQVLFFSLFSPRSKRSATRLPVVIHCPK